MKGFLDRNKHPIIRVGVSSLPIYLTAMIDTGARDSFMFTSGNPETENRLNKTGKRVIGVAAGGYEINCPEILETISIGKLKFDVLFGYTSAQIYEVDMILGTKFLHDNNISLHISRGKFLLKKASNLEALYFLCHPSTNPVRSLHLWP